MIKLGTVPFINAKPILYALEKGLIEHQFRISYHNPAILSGMLSRKEIDIGLIPVAEFLREGQYKVFPDISITSFGRVDSVAMLVKRDIGDITSVAVDSWSRSSTALLRIVLEIFYGLKPEYVKRSYGPGFFNDVDAAMVFGDAGLKIIYDNPRDYRIYDLGEVWTEMTRLPFVYALFALNEDIDLGESANALLLSKSKGSEYLDEISATEAKKIGVSKEFCDNYLKHRIKYDLTEKDIQGLIKYSEYLSELGYCKKINGLNFYSITN